jgi:hypothetical protein
MLRRVALVRTEVLEEFNASTIRVTRVCELGTWAVTSNKRTRRLLVTANVVPSSPILVTLMMEALSFSETSVLTTATRRNIPEDGIHHTLYLSSYKTPWLLFIKWTILTEQPILLGEFQCQIMRTAVCRAFGTTDFQGHSSGVSRPKPLLSIQLTSQLYLRGWLDPVPVALLFGKSCSTGNRKLNSWPIARKSIH